MTQPEGSAVREGCAYATPSAYLPGLRARAIDMRFGTLHALDTVDLDLAAGTVTALLGENGSGKSTLVKVLAGINAPRAGRLELFGQPVALPLTPDRAHAAGIRILHQDLGLIASLTVAENIALSAGFGTNAMGAISRRRINGLASAALAALCVDIAPHRLVGELSLRDRTFVALARLLASDSGAINADRVLILDEPTAALGPEDALAIHAVIRQAASAGAAVLVISHHLGEVVALADRAVVLRHGKVVAATDMTGQTPASLAGLMLGDHALPITATSEKRDANNETMLTLSGIEAPRFGPVDLAAHRGEVLGISGLRAAGPGQLAALLSGLVQPTAGNLQWRDQPTSAASLLGRGLAIVPEDRRGLGVFPGFTLSANLALNTLHQARVALLSSLRAEQERHVAHDWIARLDIRPANPLAAAGSLSGGNQQKLALARALALKPQILLLDEPTQGVDVGAQAIIRAEIGRFAEAGGCVILISTNHDELLALSHRIAVFEHGRIVRLLAGAELTHGALLNAPAETVS